MNSKFINKNEFICKEDGVYLNDESTPFISKVEIRGQFCDPKSKGWSLQLFITAKNGVVHELILPKSLLVSDQKEVLKILADYGANVRLQKAKYIYEYLESSNADIFRYTTKTGWNETAFVFPDESIQQINTEPIRFLSQDLKDHRFKVLGSLDDWKENIARFCESNSRPSFLLSAAFAAPLLEHLNEDSIGINIHGSSSKGKTTFLYLAGSVFGGPDYHRQWRATSNGLESIAAIHNSLLLCLDEMGQVSPQEAGEIAYMLGNGTGKIRANKFGDAKQTHKWKLIFISTGEITLSQHMYSSGKKTKAGQEIRCLEIPIEVESEYGSLETIHDSESAAAMMTHLKTSAQNYYGVAGREFIKKYILNAEVYLQNLKEDIKIISERFASTSSSSQTQRVAHKFALIAAAGELAIKLEILPFKNGSCIEATEKCFNSWVSNWSEKNNDREMTLAFDQIRSFLNSHGTSRFTKIDYNKKIISEHSVIYNSLGYKQVLKGVDDNVETSIWYVTKNGFLEMTKGYDFKKTVQILSEKGFLICDDSRKTIQMRDPLTGVNSRFYAIKAEILGDEHV